MDGMDYVTAPTCQSFWDERINEEILVKLGSCEVERHAIAVWGTYRNHPLRVSGRFTGKHSGMAGTAKEPNWKTIAHKQQI